MRCDKHQCLKFREHENNLCPDRGNLESIPLCNSSASCKYKGDRPLGKLQPEDIMFYESGEVLG